MAEPERVAARGAPAAPGGSEASRAVVRSIYVHVPFCRSRCPYCDFAVTELPASLPWWLEAIEGEWTRVRARGDIEIEPLETLYVGGGTPSLLGERAMEGIRSLLGERLLARPELEWTAEANPEDVTSGLAAAWRESGVNRLSIGIQSFQDEALRWLGRPHRAADSRRAIEAARRAGIENINIDLAFGLPERIGHRWRDDLDRAVALRPPHVTLQEIAVEPGTELEARVERGEEAMPAAEVVREGYRLASRTLVAEGYIHYEVSSFAIPGHESRHGRAYRSKVPYLGLGNAAHSYIPPRRSWNLKSWGGYCSAARSGRLSGSSTIEGPRKPDPGESGDSVIEGEEVLAPLQSRLEAIWLGLSGREGLASDDLAPGADAVVDRWIGDGLAVRDAGVVRLTAEGWLNLDRLVVELDRTFPA